MGISKTLTIAALAAALTLPAAGAFARDRGHHDDGGYNRYSYQNGHGHGYDDGRRYGDRDHRHPSQAYARGYGRGYDKGYGGGYRDGVRFEQRERQHFHHWYKRYPAYYRPIPPGHYHGPVRGAHLPRGYYQPLHPVLVAQLRPLPYGYRYYSVGADVVIASIATGIILDVILGGR
ncbi:hypothetical protein L2U69_09300 [Zavarzinia compransoris]|uniref:hypothetical protein n=1 Tax=Zavarzinia marina TaxID=2911065 RepID=UPI001F390425|nr:hypothetical protein [Zavarzinia marina]MCF4165837.1 hypothetical protein [Zavarzinia marina]